MASAEWFATIAAALGVVGSLVWMVVDTLLWTRPGGRPVQVQDVPGDPPEGGWPTLAVIFAARNEAAMVEAATRSILAQDYPGMELFAVDDRSTDATGAILDAVAREEPRLRVVHVTALPPGWLGKSHALQSAAEQTAATWLLFTDGDIVFAPGVLRKAMALATAQGVDHLTLAPDGVTESFLERVFMSMFLLAFALKSPIWRVVDRRSKAAIGTGAFNLVRAEAFWSIGGFRRIALSVDEDLRLGQALKFAGRTAGFAFGQHAISVRWQVGFGGMIRGLEKNFFAALDFRLLDVVVGVCALLLVGVCPFVGLVVGPWWTRCICAGGVVAIMGFLARGNGQHGVRWYHGLFVPIGALALAVALLRSVFMTYRNGGVRWRDHLYPLAELKRHVRLRNQWLREVWKSTR
jgi:glycosyltransferase involved in cell wall biosynthesis